MSLFSRLLLLLVILVAAYALWPRNSSLTRFHPARIAKLETDAWQSGVLGRNFECALAYYQIFDSQHRMPPVSTIMIAQDFSRAGSLFRKAADPEGQKAAIHPLSEAFAIIRRESNAEYNSATAARSLFGCWITASGNPEIERLAKQIAEFWSMVYDLPAGRFMAAARPRAEAMLESNVRGGEDSTDWKRVLALLTESYEKLHPIVQPPEV